MKVLDMNNTNETEIELTVNALGQISFNDRVNYLKEIIAATDEDNSSNLALLCYKFSEEIEKINE